MTDRGLSYTPTRANLVEYLLETATEVKGSHQRIAFKQSRSWYWSAGAALQLLGTLVMALGSRFSRPEVLILGAVLIGVGALLGIVCIVEKFMDYRVVDIAQKWEEAKIRIVRDDIKVWNYIRGMPPFDHLQQLSKRDEKQLEKMVKAIPSGVKIANAMKNGDKQGVIEEVLNVRWELEITDAVLKVVAIASSLLLTKDMIEQYAANDSVAESAAWNVLVSALSVVVDYLLVNKFRVPQLESKGEGASRSFRELSDILDRSLHLPRKKRKRCVIS